MSKRAIMFCFCAVASLMLISTACTPPPNDLMAAAEDTINQMDQNQIDTYAKAHYDLVTAELAKAKQHMAAEEYTEAKETAEKTIELAKAAGEEAAVQRQLMRVDVDKKLPEFMERWSEISSSIEGGRGRAARALAVEAKAFADSLTENLNELKGSEMWYELNTALDAANATADEFAEKAGG
jgi:hypothetical protein